MSFRFAAAGVVLALAAPAASFAAPVGLAGVETTVTVTAPLETLGLGADLFGAATLAGTDPLAVSFPITGGSIDADTGAALIEHDGSGVTLSALADPSVAVTVGNFFIDTADGVVFGDVIGTPLARLPFFVFGPGTDLPGVELLISTTLAGALTDVFAAPDLSGATFGYAVPDVAPVPAPAALGLLATGLAGLGLFARRRAA